MHKNVPRDDRKNLRFEWAELAKRSIILGEHVTRMLYLLPRCAAQLKEEKKL